MLVNTNHTGNNRLQIYNLLLLNGKRIHICQNGRYTSIFSKIQNSVRLFEQSLELRKF